MKEKGEVAGEWFLAAECAREDDQAHLLREQVTDTFLKLRMPVYRYLLAFCGSHAEAEDLTQEAFLRLYDYLLQGRSAPSIPAWVFRVAHNLAIDRQRRRQVEEAAGSMQGALAQQQAADRAAGIESRAIEAEKLLLVRAAMEKLTPQERQCLELRAEGLRYREIADILQIAIPTVQTFLSRAVKKISLESHE